MTTFEASANPYELETILEELERIPLKHRESLIRTQQIANMVGSELLVHKVDSLEDVPEVPGVYLLGDSATTTRNDKIMAAKFSLDTKTLSGKINSAHAVLPGSLGLLYLQNSVWSEKHMSVAAKGYFKRDFEDRFSRIKTEVKASEIQARNGEISFEPIAIVVAEPPYMGKSTSQEYDLLLVTKLDESVTTLDNAPWQLGFNEANLGAAEAAASALGRFNTQVGMHGDAKDKNVGQRAMGQTSMIDFETSKAIDWDDPVGCATAVYEDFTKLLDSLVKQNFFSREPEKATAVMEALGDAYLAHWEKFPAEIQDAVYSAVASIADQCAKDIWAYQGKRA